MTLLVPDVNVLIHAFRTDSVAHDACARWLNTTLSTDRVGVSDTILTGFMRIVTHPRIFPEPTPTAAAATFTQELVEAPRSQWLSQGAVPWRVFDGFTASDAGIRGNLVSDAHIAALCLANGAHLATRDRGFARFPGLIWFDPAA